MSSLTLRIPRFVKGATSPTLLEPRRRREEALLSVVQETYVHGVSTRKVDDLVRALGIDGISRSEVSRICAALDERMGAFGNRPLRGARSDGGQGLGSGRRSQWGYGELRVLVSFLRRLSGVELVISDARVGLSPTERQRGSSWSWRLGSRGEVPQGSRWALDGRSPDEPEVPALGVPKEVIAV